MADRKHITAGGIKIGGGAPVTVQSMTNTKTEDARATAEQINRLAALGCDIARVAVPDMQSAEAIRGIKRRIGIPLVADIHFDYRLALRAVDAGADKIRINPGNIGGADKVRAVADACRARGVPIRVGVNGGSLERDILEKHGGVTPESLAESATRHVRLLNDCNFDDICISVKASSVPLTYAAYRLLHERTGYPLHLGVTEAGTEYTGTVKSSIGIGALLLGGIGDTIRVSLTAEPEREVAAGIAILKAIGLRRGATLVSCPTCARCKIDLISLAREVERRLEGVDADITVAVMGCAVNGPGEARSADFGVAGGDGEGLLFKKGEVHKKVPFDKIADELAAMIEEKRFEPAEDNPVL